MILKDGIFLQENLKYFNLKIIYLCRRKSCASQLCPICVALFSF